MAFISLIISILSFMMSFVFWKRQFRPIITISVKTVKSGNIGIAFSLKVLNSGSIPAKNVKISIDEKQISSVLLALAHRKKIKSAGFVQLMQTIIILQNGEVLPVVLEHAMKMILVSGNMKRNYL